METITAESYMEGLYEEDAVLDAGEGSHCCSQYARNFDRSRIWQTVNDAGHDDWCEASVGNWRFRRI